MRAAILAAASLVAAPGIARAAEEGSPPPAPPAADPRPRDGAAADSLLESLDRATRALHSRCGAAVVRVSAERPAPVRLVAAGRGEPLPSAGDTWTVSESVTATGFLVDSDLVLTTATAAGPGTDSLRVAFPGSPEVAAELVGADALAGVALVRLSLAPRGVRPLAFADEVPAPGAIALLFGFGSAAAPALQLGFVSAVGRAAGPYDAYLLSTVTLEPGDAGAPLLDGRGAVLGMAVPPVSDPRTPGLRLRMQEGGPVLGSPGVGGTRGFAHPGSPLVAVGATGDAADPSPRQPGATVVPASELRRIVADLRSLGRVRRGLLGVRLPKGDLAPVVNDAVPGTPAAAAGIRAGDTVLALDGRPVRTSRDLAGFLQRRAPGTVVRLRLRQADGAEREVETALAEMPEVRPVGRWDGLGVVSRPGGVLVESVAPGSSADRAGIRVGDLLLALGGEAVDGADAYAAAALRHADGVEGVEVRLRRGDEVLALRVK